MEHIAQQQVLEATIRTTYHAVKYLKIIRWNFAMDYMDLTTRQGTIIVAQVMAAMRHDPFE